MMLACFFTASVGAADKTRAIKKATNRVIWCVFMLFGSARPKPENDFCFTDNSLIYLLKKINSHAAFLKKV
jgi:hypothetical protein